MIDLWEQIVKASRNEKLPEGFSVRIIRRLEEIEEIKGFWEEMQWHPDADLDFFLCAATLNENLVKPHIMLLSRDGKPSALIIGVIREGPIEWKVGYRTVFRSRARCLEVPYGGVLGEACYSNSVALIKELIKCLSNREADLVFLNHLKVGSAIHKIAKKMPRIFCRDHLSVQNDHWRLSLPESFEAFYQGRSRNTRGNIRQYANRLKRGVGDDLTIRCFQEKGDVVRAMIDIEVVARLTYQRGLSVGFRNTLETRRKWLLAAEKGRLRAYVLYVKNSPRAFWTGYLYKKIFYSDATGYDPALKYYHPGMFLLMRMVESFCLDEKVEGIDWGFGYVDYKRKYGSENWHESCVYIFAPNFKGLRLNVLRSLTTGLSQVAKIVLLRFDVLGVIKKRWRFRLTPR